MVRQHILLILLWLLFSLLHSLLAFKKFKIRIQAVMKNNYKYYRLLYSAFATINLIIIIIYHFSINSIILWQVTMFEKILAVIIMIASVSIMILFAVKFFLELSGAGVFFVSKRTQNLIQTGLFKYVRHPLYAATLIFIWSVFLWQPYFNNLLSCICITVYTIVGISFEERKLLNDFGDTYVQYKLKTPMLLPKFINPFNSLIYEKRNSNK